MVVVVLEPKLKDSVQFLQGEALPKTPEESVHLREEVLVVPFFSFLWR
jgi:hypothetical protein